MGTERRLSKRRLLQNAEQENVEIKKCRLLQNVEVLNSRLMFTLMLTIKIQVPSSTYYIIKNKRKFLEKTILKYVKTSSIKMG